jgi:hypothetical protein
MKTNGDVMRADRLKQVMQEIDPKFDESNLKIAKFSKFCMEAAQRGLLKVTKLDNGQLEVAPADDRGEPIAPIAPVVRTSTPASTAAVAGDRAERAERDGRGRRGRRGRGGRDRDRGRDHASELAVNVGTAASAAAAALHNATPAPHDEARPEASDPIGRSGERLSRDEAFSLLRRAVAAVAKDDVPVSAQVIRERAHKLLGRDSESLSERNFSRILRDAHDASVLDVRKRGDSYEVSAAANVPSVKDQIGAQQPAKPAAEAAPVPRSITGRRAGRGKPGEIPASLLSVGVVELDTPAPAPPAPEAKATKKKSPARRGGRSKKTAKKS